MARHLKPHPRFVQAIKKLYGVKARVSNFVVCNDNRKRCLVTIPGTAVKYWKQYAKFKLEIKLNRKLGKDETVDHIDGDVSNDKFVNLQLLSRSQNAKKSALHRVHQLVTCIECGFVFEPTRNQVNSRAKMKAGPFCSRSCSGLYGSRIQYGSKPVKRKQIRISYREGSSA